jgi:uncharacterized membrane protein
VADLRLDAEDGLDRNTSRNLEMAVPPLAVLSPSTEIDNYNIKQEVLMSDLVVIVYPSEEKAEQVRQRLINLQREYLITINDAVIAVKNEKGEVKLNQLVNTTAVGAASGSFWGLLVGLLFLNPLLGVALGAASGALGGALSDFGINDQFMKDLAAKIQPGNAALFVLIKHMTADKVLKEIKDLGGEVLKTSLDETKEKQLRDALAQAVATEASAPPAQADSPQKPIGSAA